MVFFLKIIVLFFLLYLLLKLQRHAEKAFVLKNIEKGLIIESKSLEVFKYCEYIILLIISVEYNTINYGFLDSIQPWLRIVSVILFFIGMILRMIAIRTLGRFWSFRVELKKDHMIIKYGIYRYCKHPAYIGNIYLAARAIFFEAIISSVLSIILIIIFGLYRIRLEEKYILKPLRERTISKNYDKHTNNNTIESSYTSLS